MVDIQRGSVPRANMESSDSDAFVDGISSHGPLTRIVRSPGSDVNPLALNLVQYEGDRGLATEAERVESDGLGYESEDSFIANIADREAVDVAEERTVVPDTPGFGEDVVVDSGIKVVDNEEIVGERTEGDGIDGQGLVDTTEAALAHIEERLMVSEEVHEENVSVNSRLRRALQPKGTFNLIEAVEVSSGEDQEVNFEYLWDKIGLDPPMNELLKAYSLIDPAPFLSLQAFSSDLLRRGMTIIFAQALSDLVNLPMDELDVLTIDRLCDDFNDLHKTVNVQNIRDKLGVLRSLATTPFKERLDEVEVKEKELRSSIDALVDCRDALAPEKKKVGRDGTFAGNYEEFC